MIIRKLMAALLGATLITWGAFAFAVQPLEITHVYVEEGVGDGTKTTTEFTVIGTNFNNGGAVELWLGDIPLVVLIQTDTVITAKLPDVMTSVMDGSYQLVATTGGGTVRQNAFDGVTIGVQGETGPQGPQGSQGPVGADGTNGTDGADGADGAMGPRGSEGLPGEQGPPGDSILLPRAYVAQADVNIPGGATQAVIVACDENDIVTGGGHRYYNFSTSDVSFEVRRSHPISAILSLDPLDIRQAYVVEVKNYLSFSPPVQVFANCLETGEPFRAPPSPGLYTYNASCSTDGSFEVCSIP